MQSDSYLLYGGIAIALVLFNVWGGLCFCNFVYFLLGLLFLRYAKSIYIMLITLPRDVRFLSRIIYSLIKVKFFERKNVHFVQKFKEVVETKPDKICFYFEDEVWTFKDVDRLSNQVANAFQSAGYRKGDVIALMMGNSATFVCMWLGLAKIGIITALINTNLRNKPLLHCIQNGKAKGIIYASEFGEALDEIAEELGGIVKFQYGGTTTNGVRDLNEILKAASVDPPKRKDQLCFRDHLIYIYTSGTTGLPKAAIISNSRCLTLSVATWNVLGFRDDDILYNTLPLYHTAGGVLGICTCLVNGFAVVIRKKFSASQFWKDCIRYNCTVALYIGEMCRYILSTPSDPDDRKHRVRMLIGNGMRPIVWKEMIDRFNIPQVCELYGSTEGNTNLINIDQRLGAVGFFPKFIPRFLYPIDIIKVDENGQPLRNSKGLCIRCKPGEPGTFVGVISSKNSSQEFAGYVGGEKENSKKVLRDVFRKGDEVFCSGDLLSFDELGYIYFKDRIGDTFRWKGENVSTAEVEGVISNAVNKLDVTVYGVEVGNLEGRAGMATIVDPEGKVNLDTLAQELKKILPIYAQPLFIRIAKQVDLTSTFKLKKNDLQREGFNPNVIKDALYFKDGSKFVPLTTDIYDGLLEGRIRV